MKTRKPFHGAWRIIETEMWEPVHLDEFVPAQITFDDGGQGGFQMIALTAEIDCRSRGIAWSSPGSARTKVTR